MTILLTILKIIGKAILWIIAVLIVLILVMLFCPIYYEAGGKKYDKLSFKCKVKLFLGVISFRYDNSNDVQSESGLYLFGKKLGKHNKKKKVKNKRKEQKKETDEDKSLVTAEMGSDEHTDNIVDSVNAVDNAVNEQINISDDKKESTDKYKETWISEEDDLNKPIVRKVKLVDAEKIIQEKKDTSQIPVKRIKMPEEEKEKKESDIKSDDSKKSKEKNNNNEQEINAAYFLKMPTKERKILIKAVIKLLKSLLKGVKPNKFYLTGTVGLSDPALTGEIVGLAWTLNGILNKRIEISAAFDREVIEGEVYIKGRIVPVYMVFCLIRFVLVKPVRKIIKLLLKGSGDKNGKRNRK